MAEFRVDDQRLYCIFSGHMDAGKCLEIEDGLNERLAENPTSVVFDLRDVDYISSAFLRICIRTAKSLGSNNFSIINVRPNVKKAFKIAGLDEILNVR
jgi:anti-anti-sigma factor